MQKIHETRIEELARALLNHEGATVGQMTMNLFELPSFTDLHRPEGVTQKELVVSAALIELFASCRGEPSPEWTKAVGALPEPVFLMGGYEKKFPRSAERWRREAPEPLKKTQPLCISRVSGVLLNL